MKVYNFYNYFTINQGASNNVHKAKSSGGAYDSSILMLQQQYYDCLHLPKVHTCKYTGPIYIIQSQTYSFNQIFLRHYLVITKVFIANVIANA